MRNFWILFKTALVNNLKLNKLRKRFSKNRFLQILFPFVAVILALSIIAFVSFCLFKFFSMFIIVEEYYGILLFGTVIAVLICFFTSISIANSYLFVSKDYDLLMSLPLKPQTIIASKLCSLLALNYIFFALVYVPTIICYAIFTAPGILFYLLSIIIFLVGPLLIITIAAAISYFLSLIFARLKYRNVIQIISMMVLLLGFMFLYFRFTFGFIPEDAGDDIEAIQNLVGNLVNIFEKIYYPGKWVALGLTGDYLYILLYVAVSVIPFAFFIYIVGHNFSKAVARSKVSYRNKNFILKEQKATSQTKALLKREFKLIFSNANVAMNTAISPIFGTILVIFALIYKNRIISEIDSRAFLFILLGFNIFLSSMLATTANSISLEGKTLWIIKSAPLNANTIFTAKILLNLLISLPFIIINTTMVGIVLTPPIFDLIMFMLIIILFNLFDGTYSLFINLCFPKLDWDNPVRVVKQSMSSFISMFSVMIIFFGIVALALYLATFGFIVAYLGLIVVITVLLGIFIILLRTSGNKLFNRLKA